MANFDEQWKKLFDGDSIIIWRTPVKKGEYSYVLSRTDTAWYFTPEEFSEFFAAVFHVEDDSSNHNCYQ